MRVREAKLQGCLLIEPEIFEDHRGLFFETFQSQRYSKLAGITDPFVQTNYSLSHYRVLRGLHYQKRRPQGRLLSVVSGKIFDVAVDIRRQSSTFGKWESFELTAESRQQLWLPPGLAHGFLVLSEHAELEYKCTQYYDPNDEGSILWSDPQISIAWPLEDPILSEKDSAAPLLNDSVS